VARFSPGNDADARPNLRLSGIEDAARLSLGDFDEQDGPAPAPFADPPSLPAASAVALAYLALILVWFSA